MYCHNCSKEIPDTAKVCGYCGTRQTVPEPPAPEPPAPPVEETPAEEGVVPEPQAEVEAIPETPVKAEPPAPPPEPAPAAPKPAPPSPAPQPEPVVEAIPPAPAKEKRGGVPVWVWGLIGLAVIVGAVLILGPKAPPPPAPEPDARPTATRRPAPTEAPQVEEETLSGVFVGLELVEEIEFGNPDIGNQFNLRSEGGIEVFAENGSYGWYQLAHGLRPGYAVFVKFHAAPVDVYGLNMRNMPEFQAQGFRAWGTWQEPDYRDILVYTEEEIAGVEADWPLHEDNAWHEAFFANLGGGWVLIREENPSRFYNYYEYLGEEYTTNTMLLELDVIEGNVEVEQAIIFTFDDINLD